MTTTSGLRPACGSVTFCFLALLVVATAMTTLVRPASAAESIERQADWSMRAPMPTARSDVTADVLDGLVYVAGGCVHDNRVDAYGNDVCGEVFGGVEVYDPVADTWTVEAAQMAVNRTRHGAAVLNGQLYVLGGRPAGDDYLRALTSVERFDPATRTWHPVAPLPVPVSDLAAFAVGDRLYAVGGWANDYAGTHAETYEYDAAVDVWSRVADGDLVQARGDAGVAVVGGRAYLAGGFSLAMGADFGTLATLDTVEVFDPATRGWSVLEGARLSVARADKGVAAMDEGTVMVVGGEFKDSAGNHVASGAVDVLDVATGTLTSAVPLPSKRLRLAAVGVGGGEVLALGGHTQGKRVLELAEAYLGRRQLSQAQWNAEAQRANDNLHAYVVSHTGRDELPEAAGGGSVVAAVLDQQAQLAAQEKRLEANEGRLEVEVGALRDQVATLRAELQLLSGRVGDGEHEDSEARTLAVVAMVFAISGWIFAYVVAHILSKKAAERGALSHRRLSETGSANIPMGRVGNGGYARQGSLSSATGDKALAKSDV